MNTKDGRGLGMQVMTYVLAKKLPLKGAGRPCRQEALS